MNSKTACKLARALDGVTEKGHFGSDAFYANKRIFATVWHDKGEVNLKFTPELQEQYLGEDSEAFSRIDNGFGRQGWTTVHLEFIDQELFLKALTAARASSAVVRKQKKPEKKPKSGKR